MTYYQNIHNCIIAVVEGSCRDHSPVCPLPQACRGIRCGCGEVSRVQCLPYPVTPAGNGWLRDIQNQVGSGRDITLPQIRQNTHTQTLNNTDTYTGLKYTHLGFYVNVQEQSDFIVYWIVRDSSRIVFGYILYYQLWRFVNIGDTTSDKQGIFN